MKKISLFILGGLFIALSSCNEECENLRGQCPDEQLSRDIGLIQDYIAENNIEAERHSSDLFYAIHEEGTGVQPNTGNQVTVNYVGKFLDETVFDTSIDSVARANDIYRESRTYEPLSFTLGRRQVILGWDIGISLLNEGASATLLLPSYMAYGFTGSSSIPPNTVLIFEVELVSVNQVTR